MLTWVELFNGSSHYFTRTAAAPLNGTFRTVTNNFTIEALVQPTSYASGMIAQSRSRLIITQFCSEMEASGQVILGVINAGIANINNIYLPITSTEQENSCRSIMDRRNSRNLL